MFKGFRTFIFNGVILAVSIAGVILQYIDALGLSPQQAAMIGMGLTIFNTIGNSYLRTITNTPAGKSE